MGMFANFPRSCAHNAEIAHAPVIAMMVPLILVCIMSLQQTREPQRPSWRTANGGSVPERRIGGWLNQSSPDVN